MQIPAQEHARSVANGTKTRYWIVVASKDHVARGVEAGIAQACHGKRAPLQRMQPDDLGDLLLAQTGIWRISCLPVFYGHRASAGRASLSA